MLDALSRVQTRIRQIQSLLGERQTTNDWLDRELAAQRPVSAGLSPDEARLRGAAMPPESVRRLVDQAAGRTGVPAELIAAVMSAESGYRPDAVSHAGALGLMQLMPGTARGLGVTDPLDPTQNVMGGAEYLRRQLERFGSVEKALAAYNAGPGAVERHGGVPPYRETQNYVRRVLGTLRRWTQRDEE